MEQRFISIKEKADEIGKSILEVLNATGVQYAASYKGEIILSDSLGKYDTKESRPLSKDDMYGIGSTSKVYVTAAAMLLVDEGKLDIDKPYKDYVTDFEMADPRYLKITSRHLMNHSSGIYGTHFKGSFLFEDNNTFALDNLLAHLKNCTLKYEPGSYMEYCNDGFQLLEILVERISGLKFNQYLEKYFFAPLGIKNTKTPLDEYDRTQMVRCTMPPVYDGDLPYETTNVIGTGGLVSTCEDLCAFGQVLMGKKILSEKSAKAMGEKEYQSADFWVIDEEQQNVFAYGLGYDHVHLHPFDKVGLKALVKGGDTMAYHASLVIIPELDLAAAVLTAGGVSLGNYQLAETILKELCLDYGFVQEFQEEKTFVSPEKVEMPEEYKAFEGLYVGAEMSLLLEIKDGEIEMPAMIKKLVPAQTYVYVGDGKFVGEGGRNTIFFRQIKEDLTFIQCNFNIDLPGVGNVAWKGFNFQKMEKNPISAEVAAVWEKRNGKKYLLVDDFHSSGLFMHLATAHTEIKLDVNTEYGYVKGAAIVDENFAKNRLVARDVVDFRFYKEEGAEYLIARNQHHMDMDSIKELESDANSVVIGAKGFTKFFMVGEALSGKTITVTLPDAGVFVAYGEKLTEEDDAPRTLKILTTVTGNTPIELAAGDMLAFNSNPGAVFEIELD